MSHGHTSPGVYASLARLGHLPVDEVVAFFRQAKSPYEGHVVRGIPFIDWSTGNLGPGALRRVRPRAGRQSQT